MTEYLTGDINPLAGIMMLLLTQSSVTRTELMAQFSVTERTVYRHLKTLREMGLIQLKEGETYERTTTANVFMHSGPLRSFAEFADISKFLPVGRAGFWQKLPLYLAASAVVIRTPPTEDSAQTDLQRHFPLLEKAVREHRRCRFHYKGKRRSVEPYRLYCLSSIWYLAATEQQQLKMFRLSRLEWSELSPDTFEPNPAISALLALSATPWISLNTPVCVTLEADATVAHHFRTRALVSGQNIIESRPDGSLHLTTQVFHPQQLFPIIRYWLPHLKIVAPVAWQQAFEDELHRTLNTASMPDSPASTQPN
ncbi:helix-turn-helix transcriptional regulator [Citrobacter werkmanii]|uniref:helix-turn-helix transcriptional regulator n=1 Tax=Citrobacter werkmanii TaxID=67827 RepID=UPI0026560C1B|nr:transcriptional regulator [Citrobacter werkmanii]MDN8559095.1 transcriptional regulator [Citrobacter werkmanii]